jgi:hypothetical protein
MVDISRSTGAISAALLSMGAESSRIWSTALARSFRAMVESGVAGKVTAVALGVGMSVAVIIAVVRALFLMRGNESGVARALRFFQHRE